MSAVTVLGIDEAGRGAVLGPLVVAGVRAEEAQLPQLWALGARDSKLVPRAQRQALVRKIIGSGARARAIVIPSSAVDRENLTVLELGAAARLIEALAPGQVVLDAPVAPAAIPGFVAALRRRSGLSPAIVAAFPRADRDHPAVAAASLLAKVVRDGYVIALRRRFGDFGWGYPGEPKVREYLAAWISEHGAFPPICRTRWRCAQDLLFLPLPERGGSCALAGARAESTGVTGREGGTHAQTHLPTPSSAQVPRSRVPGPQAEAGRTSRACPEEEKGTAPADPGLRPRGG